MRSHLHRQTATDRPPVAGSDIEDQRSWRERFAAIGLAVVFLALAAVSIIAVASSVRVSERAAASITLSDSYVRAQQAVAAEESLERKYRLEPGPEVRARYDTAVGDLIHALNDVYALGTREDRALVDDVMTEHTTYLVAIAAMYDAVDRGDAADVLEIDEEQVDPLFESIESSVNDAAESHRTAALQDIATMQHTERVVFGVVTGSFAIGLVLLIFFARALSQHRRLTALAAASDHRSKHDPLTGLPNRSLFLEHAHEVLDDDADREGPPQCAFLLLDLDRFKETNDTHGHHHGDLLLVEIATRLTGALRNSEICARLAGDEFVVLADETDAAGAALLAGRLLDAVRQPTVIDGVLLHPSASIGISLSPTHGTSTIELLRAADVAMYEAKRGGTGYAFATAPAAPAGEGPGRLPSPRRPTGR